MPSLLAAVVVEGISQNYSSVMTFVDRFLTYEACLSALVVLALLAPPTCGVGETNYMAEGGVFASVSYVEDLLHPEGELMRKLEKYHQRAGHTLEYIKQYIDTWRAMDYESLVGEDSPARQKFYEKKLSFLKKKELELSLVLKDLKAKTSKVKKRGDEFSLTESNGEGQPRENEADISSYKLEIIQVERDLDLLRAEYIKYNTAVRKNSSSVVARSGEGGVQHPLDAYLLMKRLTKDWNQVQEKLFKLTNDTYEVLEAWEQDRENYEFPVAADLNGAAVAIVRLQDLYDLDMQDFGKGHIPADITYSGRAIRSIGQLRTWDFILLGKEAYKYGYNTRAIQWFKTAVSRSDDDDLTDEESSIIAGLKATIEKHESMALEDKSIRKKKNKKKSKKKVTKKKHKYLPLTKVPLNHEEETAVHARLCRGETLRRPEEESVLRCWLERLQSPYLLLMPLRLEEISLQPRILLYRDFLTQKQTKSMIKEARPQLHESVHGNMKGYDVSMMRISKTGWLSEERHSSDPLHKITRKIEIATLMNAVNRFEAEDYQVANYGIGGLYQVHNDVTVYHSHAMGDRLGTFLIYLSNVTAGGATVFPSLGVRVEPLQGTALFWYNLYDDGHHDIMLRHAACPVLHGSKWIATKWIYYNAQFQKRPCSLSPGVRYTYP
ncbi:Prolyl 4-hydroxylase alpha-subunit N-terminal [Trinorchestia longiramus]|nr:Prolyl 4-hydroxylase alpha-subunit N-terminal [Trinorchestia longiramus]